MAGNFPQLHTNWPFRNIRLRNPACNCDHPWDDFFVANAKDPNIKQLTGLLLASWGAGTLPIVDKSGFGNLKFEPDKFEPYPNMEFPQECGR